jgi:methylthioxylose transferase
MSAAGRRLDVAVLGVVLVVMAAGAVHYGASGSAAVTSAVHAPFLSTYRPFVSKIWTPVAAMGLAAGVAGTLVMLRRPVPVGWTSFALALLTRVSLNVSRRGPSELAYPFLGPERHNEYIAAIPLYRHDPAGFLRDYAHLGSALPEHPAGHPAGATMLLGLLAQTGAPGAWPEVVAVLVLGAATAPLTWLLARELLDDREARVATGLWILAPSVLIESATSVDAIFAFVGTLTALLLVRGRVRAGVLAAVLGTFLSYALVAVPVWAAGVALIRQGAGQAVRLAAAVAGAVVAFYAALRVATGYDAIAALRATDHRYHLGAGHRRPYWYWFPADMVAFGLGLGLPTLLAAVRGVASRRAPALALAAIVLTGALSGETKAEVERIWLFMTPFAAVAAAPAAARWRPAPVLVLLAAQAFAVEVLFRTPW